MTPQAAPMHLSSKCIIASSCLGTGLSVDRNLKIGFPLVLNGLL